MGGVFGRKDNRICGKVGFESAVEKDGVDPAPSDFVDDHRVDFCCVKFVV